MQNVLKEGLKGGTQHLQTIKRTQRGGSDARSGRHLHAKDTRDHVQGAYFPFRQGQTKSFNVKIHSLADQPDLAILVRGCR